MGIEDLQWEYNSTHAGNTTQPTIGILYTQWEYNSTHDENRRYIMGT